MNVTWIKCGTGSGIWCPLENLDLDSLGDVAGVYIIWHEGNPGRTVHVGQGAPIKDRLEEHRGDAGICAYRLFGKLRVTWASVPAPLRDGVERYLADALVPLVGHARPGVQPIAVNSPWW